MVFRYMILIFCELVVIETWTLSSESRLIHFAIFDDVMYPSSNLTIGSPRQLTLQACAELCLKKSDYDSKRLIPNLDKNTEEIQLHGTHRRGSRHSNNSSQRRNSNGDTCMSFEYISSIGYCLLLKRAAASDSQGYSALRKAEGSTYFELSKSIQDLYEKKENQVLNGKDTYHHIIYNTSTKDCANKCTNASDLLCSSFVFSSSMRVCAMSSQVVNDHTSLQTTDTYDYYQYSGIWPCNLTLPWEYRPRVIASQRYPYVSPYSFTCYFRLVAPPGRQVLLHVKTFFTNKTDCNNSTLADGVYIFDGEEQEANTIESFCQINNNKHHPSIKSSNGFLTVKMSQTQDLIISRMVYDFVETQRNCASSPCLFNATCLETEYSFQCICPNGTSGKRCEKYTGDCFSNPCINGTCYPSSTKRGYNCACAGGFTGTRCEYNINECFSSPCVHGYCQDLINGYKCVCSNTYTGKHCEINKSMASCSRHECRFGTCAMNKTGSYCQCFPGFTGSFCETDIDDCEHSPCAHGACVDHVNSYRCNCSTGYAGKHCDILVDDHCHGNPCNHGYCSINDEGFKCICGKEFTGTRCESKLTSCYLECHHGYCVGVNLSQPLCICHENFTGKYCETSINQCKDGICVLNYTDNTLRVNSIGYTKSTQTPLRFPTTSPSTPTFIEQTRSNSLATDTSGFKQQHSETAITVKQVMASVVPYTQRIALFSKVPSNVFVNTLSNLGSGKIIHTSSILPSSATSSVVETASTFGANRSVTDSSVATVETSPKNIGNEPNYLKATAVESLITATPAKDKLKGTSSTESLITITPAKDKLETTLTVERLIPTTPTKGRFETSSAVEGLTISTPAKEKFETSSAVEGLIFSTPAKEKYETSTVVEGLIISTPAKEKFETSAVERFTTTEPSNINVDSTPAYAPLISMSLATNKTDTTLANVSYITYIPPKERIVTNPDSRPTSKTATVRSFKRTTLRSKRTTTRDLFFSSLKPIATVLKPQQWSKFRMTTTTYLSTTTDLSHTAAITKPPVFASQGRKVAYVFKHKKKTEYMNTTTVVEMDKTTNYINVQKNNSSKDGSQDENVNDVIAIESILIGALLVALIIVVTVAVFVLYKRTRSGTLYISSPGPFVERNATHAKERYSARKIHSDLRSGRLFQPQAISSELYQRCNDTRTPVYARPKRRNAGVSPENSSATTSPTSSRSDNYEEVESPDLALPKKIRRIVPINRTNAKERNVVSICRGKGVISPDDSRQRISQSIDNCEKGMFSEKDQHISTMSDGNPFFKRDDGIVGLSLSDKHKSRTQEEFQSLLDEILNAEEDLSYRKSGTRSAVYHISGTDDGKSEA